MRLVNEGVCRNPAAVTNEQHIAGFWAESQREICEQPHVALAARICGRHRERVRQQPVIVWLAEKIASKQLECIRDALHFLDRMREQTPLIIPFVNAAGMCKM